MGDSEDAVTVEWVQERLRRLQRDANDIWGIQPDVSNEFHPWSPLKLIVLAGVVELYTKIIPNTFDHMYYIDLLAGSGSVEITRDGSDTERFVGSPVLTAAITRSPFAHMYLIDNDGNRSDALRERMNKAATDLDYDLAPDDYTVIEEDANEAVHDIVDDIRDQVRDTGSVHSLVFADNEGTTIEWTTIKKLTSIYSDLLINFPGSDIRRMVGNENDTRLNEFYGDNRWRAAGTDADELRAIYKGNLANAGRPVQKNVRVRGGRNFFYDVIYATRETQGGNPFMAAFDHIQENVDQLDGDDVEQVIRYMRGEATNFEPFPGPDPNQSSVEDFF